MTPAGDSEAPAAAEPAAVEPAVTETSAAPEISEAPVAAESEDKSGNWEFCIGYLLTKEDK